MAYPNDLARTKNWGNEVLTDADLEGQLDLIITWLMAFAQAVTGHKHDATANEGPKVLINNLDIAAAAEGDIYYRNATVPARLAKGTKGQVLKINDAEDAPEWGGAQLSDAILRGFELTYKTAADVYVEPGSLLNGTTLINTTARTTLTLATAADWWDGAVDSYAGGAGWCYIGVDVSGNIKLLGANPPDKADNAGNAVGTLLYWFDGTLYWRVIGALRVHTDDTILYKFYQQGNWIYYDDPILELDDGAETSFTDVDLASAVPALSQLIAVDVLTSVGNYTISVSLRRNGSVSTNGRMIAKDTTQAGGSAGAAGCAIIDTDSSQIIEYKVEAGTTDLLIAGYYIGGIR